MLMKRRKKITEVLSVWFMVKDIILMPSMMSLLEPKEAKTTHKTNILLHKP
jgi:hypothetical protein